jgi:pimeloyl-ACP methyl ester carboxylesterase
MQPWTTEMFVEDVAAAAQFVRETSRAQKILVGGFGLGATFTYLYAARHWREDLLGLVILDGYVLDPPDAFSLYRERSPTPNWFADDLEGRFMPYKRLMKILQDVIDDPSGPDFLPAPVFNSRAEALAHFLYANANFGAQGGLSNAKGGYADISILARILRHQDRYWPRVQNHGGFEFHRHLAKATFDYERALHEINVPILAFTNGNVGPEWEERVEYSGRATAAKDVQYRVLLQWGHLDVLLGNYAAQEVFQPVSDWMARHTPSAADTVVSR